MLCSTDDYKNIKVTKEHVDYIVEFIKKLYDNPVFRLKEYADEEKSYKIVVDKDTKELESLYPKNVTFIDFLSNTSKVKLLAASPITLDTFKDTKFSFLIEIFLLFIITSNCIAP